MSEDVMTVNNELARMWEKAVENLKYCAGSCFDLLN
jgi:hypothetical protein